MDICYNILDACSLVGLAPCPPPDIENNTFYNQLAQNNLTVQVMLHIAVRCGISVIQPTSTDRIPLLITVCLVFVLIVIITVIIELRKRPNHRSVKEHADALNGPETVMNEP
ncbi:uncharacterized protein LOC128210462 [Mya arenaria]|uniref:uncharacterized protein LOC128210462 n=1 Tax=Mya arenaria TaxID=6604 RepID=UPI0022E92CDC|nr:uncharacterized protein LOC128210462 [Mya arenaria]